MRIAFLLPDFRAGGAQHMVINMANELSSRGHHVFLWVMQDQGPFKNKISPSLSITILNKSRAFLLVPAVALQLKANPVDILYSAMPYMNFVAIMARILSGSKKTAVMISERNYFSLSARGNGSSPSFIQKVLIMLLYPLADSIVGISRGVAEDIATYLLYRKDRVTSVHNPVVTKNMAADSLQDISDAWLDNATRPLIVTSGRLVQQKDQKTLLRAFAKLLKKRDASLLVLGEGPLRVELETLARLLNISARVCFKGYVDNPLAYMKRADLFVLSSAWEGFCNVLVEALLCGLPIVSTDCPSGPAEILKNGVYGRLVPVGDEAELAEAMDLSLAEKVDAERQRNRAEDFSVQNICDSYEKLMMQVAT